MTTPPTVPNTQTWCHFSEYSLLYVLFKLIRRWFRFVAHTKN